MSMGAPERFHVDLFAGHRFDDIRAGDEHVTAAPGHHHEIGQARGIDGPACTGPQHEADLRYHAAGLRVVPEQVSEASQTPDPFLDAGADGVEHRDNRQTRGRGGAQQASHFLRLHLRKRPTAHGEVLREHRHPPPFNQAKSRDDAVAGVTLLFEPESGVAMLDERRHFFERLGVEQTFDAFTRGELPSGVLRVDTLLAAAQAERGPLGRDGRVGRPHRRGRSRRCGRLGVTCLFGGVCDLWYVQAPGGVRVVSLLHWDLGLGFVRGERHGWRCRGRGGFRALHHRRGKRDIAIAGRRQRLAFRWLQRGWWRGRCGCRLVSLRSPLAPRAERQHRRSGDSGAHRYPKHLEPARGSTRRRADSWCRVGAGLRWAGRGNDGAVSHEIR